MTMTDYLVKLDDPPDGQLKQGMILQDIPFLTPDLPDFQARGDGETGYSAHNLKRGDKPPPSGHVVAHYEFSMGLVINSECDLVEERGDNILVAQVRPTAGEIPGLGQEAQPKRHATEIKAMNTGRRPNVFFIPEMPDPGIPASFADFHEIQRFANEDYGFLAAQAVVILAPLARELLRDRLRSHFARVGVPNDFGMNKEQAQALFGDQRPT